MQLSNPIDLSFCKSNGFNKVFYFVFSFLYSLSERPELIIFLLVTCIFLSGTAGISTAIIVKKLDNIVKLYTQALSNMLTSLACAIFFPNKFHISPLFIFCIVLVFVAIFLYEQKTVESPAMNRVLSSMSTSPGRSLIVCVLVVGLLGLIIWELSPEGISIQSNVSSSINASKE